MEKDVRQDIQESKFVFLGLGMWFIGFLDSKSTFFSNFIPVFFCVYNSLDIYNNIIFFSISLYIYYEILLIFEMDGDEFSSRIRGQGNNGSTFF